MSKYDTDAFQRGIIPGCEHTPRCTWHFGPCADKHRAWLAQRRDAKGTSMGNDIEITAERVVTIKLSEGYAGELERALARVLTALDHPSMEAARRSELVHTGTLERLLALKTALAGVAE